MKIALQRVNMSQNKTEVVNEVGLEKAILMLKKNSNPDNSIQIALMNLEYLKRMNKFKENRYSRLENSLNFYIKQNGILHSKLKSVEEKYDCLKIEQKTNEISSEKTVSIIRSIFWQEIEDLKQDQIDKNDYVELLKGLIYTQLKQINRLKQERKENQSKLSTMKRKSDTNNTEKNRIKRRRHMSA